jgi:hypothetical protein
MILGCIIFLYFNRCFILSKLKIKARVTSYCLDMLPKDGLLVEGLIAYPIVYRTHKRVVVLPHSPNPEDAKYQTMLSIEQFSLNYAVFSDLWKTEETFGYPAIQFIKDNFKLLRTITEDQDTYYIYEI